MENWVKVEERLPISDTLVIVVDSENDYFIDKFYPSSGWGENIDIMAWTYFKPSINEQKKGNNGK